MTFEHPMISVVTVCYNAVASIEETIKSVINQTYSNIEYIIIDGKSKDGTIDIIKKYSKQISFWISESDKGIYDAMNKGIDNANGKYILFLNSGDYFYSNNSISKVFDGTNLNDDVIYGNVAYKYSYGLYIRKNRAIDKFNQYMPIAHPATFVKTELIKRSKFNVNYKVSADYDMLYRLYKEGRNFKQINEIITVFEAESGVSSTSYLLAKKECAIINRTYGGLSYFKMLFILSLNTRIKKFMATCSKTYYLKLQKRKRDNNEQFVRL